MALLNTKYVNPQAQILYGAGNTKISDAQIRDFINTPGRTDAEIKGAALANNVSAAQVSRAMSRNPDFAPGKIDAYLSSQGITKELEKPLPELERAQIPAPTQFKPTLLPPSVRNEPIVLGVKDTVAGQMDSFLKDSNHPLNVQAQTFGNQQANSRGLLNSSVGVSAAQDAMYKNAMPIAAQDASTSFAAKRQNSQQELQANTFNNELAARIGMSNSGLDANVGMFNNDLASRIGMFNAGTSKDVFVNQANLDMNRYIAELDTDSKLKVANIQAMANDSSIMGDLGKSMMNLYTSIVSDPNMSPDAKREATNNIFSQFDNLASFLPSFEKIAPLIKFGANNTGSTANNAGNNPANGSTQNNIPAPEVNVLKYQVEPSVSGNVTAYEKATGQKIDRSRVAPEALVMDIKSIGSGPTWYTGSDGSTKMANNNAYDINGLMQKYSAGSVGDLFNRMFVPVHPPGTMRADAPMFYVFR